jgi:hypothetical protein
VHASRGWESRMETHINSHCLAGGDWTICYICQTVMHTYMG